MITIGQQRLRQARERHMADDRSATGQSHKWAGEDNDCSRSRGIPPGHFGPRQVRASRETPLAALVLV